MANISSEIAEIEGASRGADVRQSIVDALNAINREVLPSVTSSDEGKILVVNDEGEWDVDEFSDFMPIPTATKAISSNGTYDVTNYASASVNVSGGGASLITKNITSNGTYNAQDDNASGYSSVTVAVPKNIVYEWNFKESLSEKKYNLIQANLLGNAYRTNADGIVIPDSVSGISFKRIWGLRMFYEIEFSEFHLDANAYPGDYYIIGASASAGGSYPDRGIFLRQSDGHVYMKNASNSLVDITNVESNMSISNYELSGKMAIGMGVASYPITFTLYLPGSNTSNKYLKSTGDMNFASNLFIGSTDKAMYPMKITGFKVLANSPAVA